MSFLNKICYKNSFYNVIKKQYITEKTMGISDKYKKFFFSVDIAANKFIIKKAIENIFHVKVKKISIINIKKKKKLFRGTKGYKKNWKKAMITLIDGHDIDFAKIK